MINFPAQRAVGDDVTETVASSAATTATREDPSGSHPLESAEKFPKDPGAEPRPKSIIPDPAVCLVRSCANRAETQTLLYF